ncbi:putative methyltransferase PMT2 [Hordeum vulgare]|nr:putative methyltransferase PMT2 [Hordeum vulgare]
MELDQQEPAEEAPPLDVGEEKAPVMEDVDVWPEHLAILNSIRTEWAVEAKRLRRQQMEATRAAQEAA